VSVRTTLDIDDPVLRDLRRVARAQRRPLSRVASELLAKSLARPEAEMMPQPEFRWHARAMGARVDVADRDAVYEAMERFRGGEG
jgi:hypothetical protein